MHNQKTIITTGLTVSPVQPPGLTELLNLFISDQDVREGSKINYRRILNQYFKWVSGTGNKLSDLTRSDILNYKDNMLRSGMSSLSVSTYLSSVRRFYEWVEGKRYYPNIAKGVRSAKRRQQFRKEALVPEQSRALLDHCLKQSSRDYAIVAFLLGTGVRTIELIRANINDITFKGGKRVIMVHGKGRDERDDFVKLPDSTFQAISNYLKTRPRCKVDEPLFTSKSNNSRGKRLTTRSISKIVKEGLKDIGLNNRSLTAHSLRHTTAVTILKAGLGIEYAQGVLRHASSTTTQIYIASIKEEMRLNDQTETILNQLFI